jgi:hypothetical protein
MPNLYMLCGRLDGWDDDIAMLIPANDPEQAVNFFVAEKLIADNGYEKGDRESYVHQCELVGELLPDGLLQLAEGLFE